MNDGLSVDSPLFQQTEQREQVIVETEEKLPEQLERMETQTETAEIEGEIEEEEQEEDQESEYEQDFEIYFKEQSGPSLQIHNDAHFVLINDDELFNAKHNQNDHNDVNNKPDEWLLV